jgi:hypothetical protein
VSSLPRSASPGEPGRQGAAAGQRLFFVVVMLASAAALAVAALAIRLGGRADCAPCLYQLAPYVVASAVAAAAMWMRPPAGKLRVATLACAMLFAFGCAVSMFREGVQQGWWALPVVCEDPAPAGTGFLDAGLTDLCDAAVTTFDGIALSTLNFLYSALLTFTCAVMAAVGDFGDGANNQHNE